MKSVLLYNITKHTNNQQRNQEEKEMSRRRKRKMQNSESRFGCCTIATETDIRKYIHRQTDNQSIFLSFMHAFFFLYLLLYFFSFLSFFLCIICVFVIYRERKKRNLQVAFNFIIGQTVNLHQFSDLFWCGHCNHYIPKDQYWCIYNSIPKKDNFFFTIISYTKSLYDNNYD